MARTAVTGVKTSKVSGVPGAVQAITPAAADATNFNSFANTGRELLLVVTDANARTIKFYDRAGAQVGSTLNLAASKTYIFGPFDVYNYGSTLNFDVSNTAVTVAVVALSDYRNAQTNTGG